MLTFRIEGHRIAQPSCRMSVPVRPVRPLQLAKLCLSCDATHIHQRSDQCDCVWPVWPLPTKRSSAIRVKSEGRRVSERGFKTGVLFWNTHGPRLPNRA